jgi:hypothetical protein
MYRQKDIDIINNNLDSLEDKAKGIYLQNYEPTIEEINSVYKIIKNYIRENGLIIYGGYAQNALIKVKNPDAVFYKEVDVPDIEFYSYEPLKNLIELCDILYKEGFKHVEGKEGMHPSTYKIFVNFIAFTDFSYMPKYIFDNCPTITIEGMKMTHPHFMLVDAYRVYSDPMTSYFRLRKTFSRFTRLMEYYSFNDNTIYNKLEYSVNLSEKQYDEINRFIRKKILHKNKIIVIGHRAFNRLMRKAGMPSTYIIQEPFYQLISINYDKDRTMIYDLLKNNCNKDCKITTKEYHPFFQFFDKSTEYYYNEQLVIRLYGANEKCIVYRYSPKKKTYFGSFQLQIQYLLANYQLGVIRQNNFNKTAHMTMITRMFKARETYLDKNNASILNDTPFQSFTLKCMGEPKDPIRSSLLAGLERKKKGKQMKFSYRPSGKPGKIPDYRFDNLSGNLKNN